MPWPVYSETFTRTAAAGGWTSYTVPAGHRAVVKSASFINGSAAAGEYACRVGGIMVVYGQFPASFVGVVVNFMAVAYAGQKVETLAAAAGVHQTSSGFLFRDSAVAGDRELEEGWTEWTPGDPWEDEAQHDDPARGSRRSDSVQRGVRRWGLVGRDVARGRETDRVRALLRSQAS